jgi:mevalonate kinase
MKKSFTAKAPAKLIISGEHSVLYGAPAISLAINQYVFTTINWLKKYQTTPIINFNLLNLKYAKSHTLKTLMLIKEQLQANYNDFLIGETNIRQVIKKPFQLLQYLVSNFVDKLHVSLPQNLDIQVNSGIPIGSGLGSSAAVIVSCLRSLTNLFRINWDPNRFLKLAKEIENLQHGKSSGLDLYTSIFGGCNYFANILSSHAENIILPNFGFKIVNTGQPQSTTGECVSVAKENLQKYQLINNFADTTNYLKQAIISSDQQQCIDAIKENHSLLCKLGVVPEKIRNIIKAIEQAGGAAKICGAGSLLGGNAGVLLLLGDLTRITPIIAKYEYNLQDIQIDYTGVSIV